MGYGIYLDTARYAEFELGKRKIESDYTSDKEAYSVDDEYMLGEDLLVAPAFLGKSEREIYLPEGVWENYLRVKRSVAAGLS